MESGKEESIIWGEFFAKQKLNLSSVLSAMAQCRTPKPANSWLLSLQLVGGLLSDTLVQLQPRKVVAKLGMAICLAASGNTWAPCSSKLSHLQVMEAMVSGLV